MTTLFALIIVLGVLIFFHELGHFLVARLFGVGVEKFSLGFGPRLFGFKSGITDYQVSAIPLGGYVKMVGEDPDAEEELSEADIPLSFTHKHVAKRFCIVAAGPVFNMLLAVLIFYGLFQVYGMAHLQPVIGEVTPASPAHAAGLMAGDRVVAVDDAAVVSCEEMALMIRDSGGRMLRLTVQRGDGLLKVDVRPDPTEGASIFGEPQTHYRIGVAASGEVVRERLNPVAALRQRDEFVGSGQGQFPAPTYDHEQVGVVVHVARIVRENHDRLDLLAAHAVLLEKKKAEVRAHPCLGVFENQTINAWSTGTGRVRRAGRTSFFP